MFLGLDLGTSNVKVLIVAPDGSVAAEGSAPLARSTTPGGGVEQDIDQIWDATCQAVAQAVRQTDGRPVQALGVSSQGGALQLLDAHQQPLGRVISWLDPRGAPFDRQLEEQLGEAYLVAHTGCNLSAMTLGQLLRLRQHSPELLDAAPGFLPPPPPYSMPGAKETVSHRQSVEVELVQPHPPVELGLAIGVGIELVDDDRASLNPADEIRADRALFETHPAAA